MKGPVCITNFDMQRLRILLSRTRMPVQLDLESLLDHAIVVCPEKAPVDFVTLNTRMRIKDVGSGEEQLIQLVFPADEDPACGKVSVFTPLGTALIGYRAGDKVECKISSEIKLLLIQEITYQPEAEGLL